MVPEFMGKVTRFITVSFSEKGNTGTESSNLFFFKKLIHPKQVGLSQEFKDMLTSKSVLM